MNYRQKLADTLALVGAITPALSVAVSSLFNCPLALLALPVGLVMMVSADELINNN